MTDAGLVVTSDGRVFAETTWDKSQLDNAVARAGRLAPPARVPGTAASLISLWSNNFHHWLLDALPRYGVLERAGQANLPLVVPRRLTRFQRESLALLGVQSSSLVPYRGSHVAPDTLVWPSAAAHIGNPTPSVVEWLRQRLGPRDRDPFRRLYVTRAQVEATELRRRIANEVELVKLLLGRGFEVVRPELLSLAQQAALFAEAEIVVGAHGAAHTNTLFSRRSVLIELFEPSFFNNCNLMLSRASGHDYWYVTGERSGPGDIIAPLELVEATLDCALSTTTPSPRSGLT